MSTWLGARGQHQSLRELDHHHPGLDFVHGDSEMGVFKQDCIDTGSWVSKTLIYIDHSQFVAVAHKRIAFWTLNIGLFVLWLKINSMLVPEELP